MKTKFLNRRTKSICQNYKNKGPIRLQQAFLILLFIFASSYSKVNADGITFNSPSWGAWKKPGETFNVGHSYHNPGDYRMSFTYWNYGFLGAIAQSTISVYNGESRGYSFTIPCNAVSAPNPDLVTNDGLGSARFNVENVPGLFNHKATGVIYIKIIEVDLNLPPEGEQLVYTECGDSQVSQICIKSQRTHHYSNGGQPVSSAENRYIRWYGTSNDLVGITPAQLKNNIMNRDFNIKPILEGPSATCIDQSKIGNNVSLLVTGTLLYPNCGSEDDREQPARTSLPTLIPIISLPNINEIIPDFGTVTLNKDDQIICPDELKCKVPTTYMDLPGLGDDHILYLQSYGITVDELTSNWICDDYPEREIKRIATGHQRVCYKDLDHSRINKSSFFTGYHTIKGTAIGQPIECTQTTRIFIQQGGNLPPHIVAALEVLYNALKATETILGKDACIALSLMNLDDLLGTGGGGDNGLTYEFPNNAKIVSLNILPLPGKTMVNGVSINIKKLFEEHFETRLLCRGETIKAKEKDLGNYRLKAKHIKEFQSAPIEFQLRLRNDISAEFVTLRTLQFKEQDKIYPIKKKKKQAWGNG